MICLLCPSPAVADMLCVPCGAKLWVSLRYETDYDGTTRERERILQGRFDYHPAFKEREKAMRELDAHAAFQFGARHSHALQIHKTKAQAFHSRLGTARAERAAKEGER